MTELITLAQKLRPRVDWLPLPDDFELPESLESVVPANEYYVYGDIVHGDKILGDKVMGDQARTPPLPAGEKAAPTAAHGVETTR